MNTLKIYVSAGQLDERAGLSPEYCELFDRALQDMLDCERVEHEGFVGAQPVDSKLVILILDKLQDKIPYGSIELMKVPVLVIHKPEVKPGPIALGFAARLGKWNCWVRPYEPTDSPADIVDDALKYFPALSTTVSR